VDLKDQHLPLLQQKKKKNNIKNQKRFFFLENEFFFVLFFWMKFLLAWPLWNSSTALLSDLFGSIWSGDNGFLHKGQWKSFFSINAFRIHSSQALSIQHGTMAALLNNLWQMGHVKFFGIIEESTCLGLFSKPLCFKYFWNSALNLEKEKEKEKEKEGYVMIVFWKKKKNKLTHLVLELFLFLRFPKMFSVFHDKFVVFFENWNLDLHLLDNLEYSDLNMKNCRRRRRRRRRRKKIKIMTFSQFFFFFLEFFFFQNCFIFIKKKINQ